MLKFKGTKNLIEAFESVSVMEEIITMFNMTNSKIVNYATHLLRKDTKA